MTSIEAELTAGPAISNTKAAPGVRPLAISDTAMGMEPVAQTYMGMATASTKSILSSLYSCSAASHSLGTVTVMSAAMSRPVTNHLPTSCIMSTKA